MRALGQIESWEPVLGSSTAPPPPTGHPPDSKGKTFTVPKGDICAVSTSFQHRVASLFEAPDVFDHKRFLEPRAEDKAAKFSFIGFGGGRHGCLGTNFAYLQIKTVRGGCLSGAEQRFKRAPCCVNEVLRE